MGQFLWIPSRQILWRAAPVPPASPWHPSSLPERWNDKKWCEMMWNDPIQMDWNRFKWIDMNCFFFCASIGLWASFQVPEPPRYFGTASESCIFWTKVVTFFEGCGCTKPSSRFIEILKIAVTDNGTINDHHLPRPFTSSKTNTTQWFNGLYKKWRGGSALDWKVHSTWTLSQSWLSSLENLFVGQLYRLYNPTQPTFWSMFRS